MSDLPTAIDDLDKAVNDEIAYDQSLATEINNLKAAAAQLTTDGAATDKLNTAIADIESKAAALEANVTAGSAPAAPAPAAAAAPDQMTTAGSIGGGTPPADQAPADEPPAP
jgi:hypothetical protein